VGKPEGKRPLGRPRRRWEDGIRMDLREIGCGLDSTVSGQGPVAGCCECGDEPSGSCATELVSLVKTYFCRINTEIQGGIISVWDEIRSLISVVAAINGTDTEVAYTTQE
jgi:hypothetical protein